MASKLHASGMKTSAVVVSTNSVVPVAIEGSLLLHDLGARLRVFLRRHAREVFPRVAPAPDGPRWSAAGEVVHAGILQPSLGCRVSLFPGVGGFLLGLCACGLGDGLGGFSIGSGEQGLVLVVLALVPEPRRFSEVFGGDEKVPILVADDLLNVGGPLLRGFGEGALPSLGLKLLLNGLCVVGQVLRLTGGQASD